MAFYHGRLRQGFGGHPFLEEGERRRYRIIGMLGAAVL